MPNKRKQDLRQNKYIAMVLPFGSSQYLSVFGHKITEIRANLLSNKFVKERKLETFCEIL